MVCYMCGHEVKHGTEFNDSDNHFPDCQRIATTETDALLPRKRTEHQPHGGVTYKRHKRPFSSED